MRLQMSRTWVRYMLRVSPLTFGTTADPNQRSLLKLDTWSGRYAVIWTPCLWYWKTTINIVYLTDARRSCHHYNQFTTHLHIRHNFWPTMCWISWMGQSTVITCRRINRQVFHQIHNLFIVRQIYRVVDHKQSQTSCNGTPIWCF